MSNSNETHTTCNGFDPYNVHLLHCIKHFTLCASNLKFANSEKYINKSKNKVTRTTG